jgi:hypothetical protein
MLPAATLLEKTVADGWHTGDDPARTAEEQRRAGLERRTGSQLTTPGDRRDDLGPHESQVKEQHR